jgi:hypothetical protein
VGTTLARPEGIDLLSSAPEPGRPAAFLLLLAFLVAWLFIRTSARLIRSPKVPWWPGNVQTGSGLHIHHLVWGIVLMLLSGFVAFASDLSAPWWQITSIGFGIGAGLTLDEYALWLRLEDVYWSEEGRASIDAVVIAVLFAGLVVLGVQPLGLDESSDVLVTGLVTAAALVFVAVTFLKGRMFLGVVALFVPVLGVYAACRLAKPTSVWAKRRYGDGDKLERARARWAPDRPGARVGRRLMDAIGGRPDADPR